MTPTAAATDQRVPNLLDTLIEELERLPAQPSVALRTVWVADDPKSSARDLAAAVLADPSLTARLLRLANSAYYGLSRRVADVGFAITVVGFQTVRAIAAASAGGLFEPGAATVPAGFWEHAVATATVSSVLAPRAGVRAPEAFALGLLHDLGGALLFRTDPARYEAVLAETRRGVPLTVAERDAFGMAHDEAGARVFAAWRFPEEFSEAVAAHHGRVGRSTSAGGRVLLAAEAVAARLVDVDGIEPGADAGLSALKLDADDADALARRVKEDTDQLLVAFS